MVQRLAERPGHDHSEHREFLRREQRRHASQFVLSQSRQFILATAAALAVAVIVVTLFHREPPVSAPALAVATPAPETTPAPPSPARPAQEEKPIAPPAPARPDPRTAGSPLAAELNAPAFDARHDVATLHAILRQYLRLLHGRQGHPIGNDSDLARVLTGQNPMKLVILPPNHPALSADGRLRDRWGTPYFIHPRGNLAFEIRSAGPDRKLFTADDLIENPGGANTDLRGLPPEPEATPP